MQTCGVLWSPLTGRFDFLRGLTEGFTVSPAALRAAILDSMSETWKKQAGGQKVAAQTSAAGAALGASRSPFAFCFPGRPSPQP